MDMIKPKKNKPKFQTRNKNHEKISIKNNESKDSKSKLNPIIYNNSNKIAFSENTTHKENNNNEDEIKYFEFNAHFKYQDLCTALSALKNLKEESSSNTTKENTKLNSIHNTNVGNLPKHKNKKINNNNNQDIPAKNFCKKKSEGKKGFSRNIEMNNCKKYLEYIQEQKEKSMTFSIVKSYYKENKTLFLPKADILMDRIKGNLEKLKHEREINKISKKKKFVNKNIKNNNKLNFMKERNNLITISLINNNISNRNNLNNDKNSKLKNSQINLNNPKNLSSKKNITNLNSNIFSISSRKPNPKNQCCKQRLCSNNKKLNITKHISQNNKYLRKVSEGGEIKKTKAKSTSATKSNKKNTIHKTNLKSNQQKINLIKEKFAKQKTINNKILTPGTYNKIKITSVNKSVHKKTLEVGSENKHPKIRIVTFHCKNIWKIRNKLNKKTTINSFVTSVDKTKENEKSKSKSNLKSNSFNKNKLFKNNYTINSCQKTAVNNNQKDKIANCSLNLNKKKYEVFYSRNKISNNNYVTNNLINTKLFSDSQSILHLPKNTITNHSNDINNNRKLYNSGINKKQGEKSGTRLLCNNNVVAVINSTCRITLNAKNSFGIKIKDLKKKNKSDKKNIPHSNTNINNCVIDLNKKSCNNIGIGVKQNKENKDNIKK